MKPAGNVAAMTPAPEIGTREVIMSADVSKMEEKRSLTPSPRVEIAGQGKAATQANPGKAPLEITNAIKRRRETSDLDYYWPTLPPAPPSPTKPIYRAVLRGSLMPGDKNTTVCTLSSIVDAVSEREYNLVFRKNNANNLTINGFQQINGNFIHNTKNNFSVVRAEEMGLTINGLGIGELKAKPLTNNIASPVTSPRGSGWKGYTSTAILRQRKSGQNSNTNNKTTSFNSTPDKTNNATETTSNKNGRNNAKTNQQPSINKNNNNNNNNNSNKSVQRTPRLSLTNRHQSNPEDSTESKRVALSLRNESIVNKKDNNSSNSNPTSPDITPRSPTPSKNWFLSRQTSLPLPHQNDAKGFSDAKGHNSIPRLHAQSTDTDLAKKKFSTELDKKLSHPNPSCLQLADSIISALTVDLNQMYSICQTKVRYAEFIETLQPHRLEHTTGQAVTSSKKEGGSDLDVQSNLKSKTNQNSLYNSNKNTIIDNYNNSCLSKTHPKEMTSLSSNSPPKPAPSQHEPATNNKNSPPLRLAPLTPRTNKYSAFREPHSISLDNTRISPLILGSDKSSPRAKTTRPILKSSKTDIDTSLPMCHPTGASTDSNNNTGMGSSNRLVRFKVNHEVREFTPSDPVRYY